MSERVESAPGQRAYEAYAAKEEREAAEHGHGNYHLPSWSELSTTARLSWANHERASERGKKAAGNG